MNQSCRFKDHTGQEWRLHLTYGLGEEIKKETGVNLAMVSKNHDWVDLLFDEPGRIVSVLWLMCEGQAKELGVSPEDFGKRFDGPTLEAAGDALAFAIADFFPRSKIAEAIKKRLPEVMDKAEAMAIKRVMEVNLTDSPSVSNSPELSESIPAS